MSLTYREIKSQYAALRKTFDYVSGRKDEIISFYRSKRPKSITFTGCGSSYCLCQSAEFSAKARLGIPSTALAAGDLMLNYKSYEKLLDGTMLIAPSRSGSTTEVLNAVKNVKSMMDVPVLSITCVNDSALSAISDISLEIPWAFDDSVCQTRTVANLYTANLLLIAILSGDESLRMSIDKAINLGEDFMEAYEEKLKVIAYEGWENVVILADGEMQGVAAEAAIAFTEIAEISGQYYHLLDVRHGPMVMVNEKTLVIVALTSVGFTYQKNLINDLIKKGAAVITYSSLPLKQVHREIGREIHREIDIEVDKQINGQIDGQIDTQIDGVRLQVTSGEELDAAACGIPFIFISQILAFYKSEVMGTNPDNPNGLKPWIEL